MRWLPRAVPLVLLTVIVLWNGFDRPRELADRGANAALEHRLEMDDRIDRPDFVTARPLVAQRSVTKPATVRLDLAAGELRAGLQARIVYPDGSREWARSLPAQLTLIPGTYRFEACAAHPEEIAWLRTTEVSRTLRSGTEQTIVLEATRCGGIAWFRRPAGTSVVVATRGDTRVRVYGARGYRDPFTPESTLLAAGWWRFEARDLYGKVLAQASARVEPGRSCRVPWTETGR